MWRRVALVRADVLQEHIASIIRAKRIRNLGILRSVLQFLVTDNVVSCYPYEGGDTLV
jgi:hypothetical protein